MRVLALGRMPNRRSQTPLIPIDESPPVRFRAMPSVVRIVSWNVNGIRAAYRKGFADVLQRLDADVLCLQETKARPDQLSETERAPADYAGFWNPAERPGYSGTAIFTRIPLRSIQTEFQSPALNGEGRIVAAEFADITLFCVYFPNGKRDAGRLQYKLDFYEAFLDLAEAERARGRGVIFCGDVNTAHTELDLARPKENAGVSGFLPEERAWIDRVVGLGYIDTFRTLHPDARDAYTWWDQLTRARDRNVGWRIDYVFVSPDLRDRIVAAEILPDVYGSDHCPVSLDVRLG